MASIFSRILAGDIPGRVLWRDDTAAALLDVRPLSDGHTLVVPIEEVDLWVDLPAPVAAHLMSVAHAIGNAQREVFQPRRIGLMIAGFEVPHAHVHVMPVTSMREFDFARANADPDPAVLDRQAEDLRAALRRAGHDAVD